MCVYVCVGGEREREERERNKDGVRCEAQRGDCLLGKRKCAKKLAEMNLKPNGIVVDIKGLRGSAIQMVCKAA